MSLPPERADWLERAHVALRDAGLRTGGAREAVLAVLAATGGGLTAQGVLDEAAARGNAVGLASAYRILADLERVGAVRRVGFSAGRGHARHELVLGDGAHHHHLVCDRCGRTDVFVDTRLEQAIHAVERSSPYEVRAHDVVLRGTCERCRR